VKVARAGAFRKPLEGPPTETQSLKYGRTAERGGGLLVTLPRASKFAAVAVLALLVVPSLGAAARAPGAADPPPAPLPDAPAIPAVPEVAQRGAAGPAEPTVLNPGGEPLTAGQAIARAARVADPSGDDATSSHPPPTEYPSEPPTGPVPLADTDDNDPAKARWINATDTQFTGESINGASTGSPARRTDIDWWRFRLGYTPTTADTISFDITKDAWDHVEVYVYTWPDADPEGNSAIARYDYMNRTQGLGNPSSFSFTAFEDNDYVMLIQTLFRRAGCCVVNYSITNIAFSTATPSDDNNNLTKSEAIAPALLPTNREVDQASDWYDVFDLTGQLTIDDTRGDTAIVAVGFSVSAGRTGFTDVYNSTPAPWGSADGDAVLSYGVFLVVYQDPANYWRVLPQVALSPGNTGTVQGLINGTPTYVVVRAAAVGANSGVLSSVPGWIRYNVTALSIQEDHAPVKVEDIPTLSMLEDTPSSGANLVDLSAYFTDDIDAGALWFSVTYTQFAFVSTSVSGSWLSVTVNQPEWSGSVTLRVAAHDLGWDRVASVDDHRTLSNYFPVQVQPVNDPPRILAYGGQAVSGPSISFAMSQGQTLVLSATATDPEDNGSLVWSWAPALAFATLNATTGRLTLTPANEHVGNHTVALTVRDPSSASANLTVNVRVDNVNDPPRFVRVGGMDPAGPLDFEATQGTPFAVVLDVEDPDLTVGIPQAFSFACDQGFIAVTPNPSDPAQATASFTPTNAHVGLVTVRCSVGDGPAGVFQDNATLNITVANKNDPPVFTHVGTTTGVYQLTSKTFSFLGLDGAIQGRDFVLTVRADDLDVAAGLGDALTFETDMPGKVLISPNAGGLSADLLFIPTQADASAGQVQVTVYVNDSLLPRLGDVLTIIIDVTNVNDPPVLAPVVSLTLTQDERFSYSFEATDPDGDAITFSSDSELFPLDSTTGSIDFVPTNADIGGADKVFEVTITARDGEGGVATMRITVVIENVNDAPRAAQIQNPAGGERFGRGEPITFSGSAVDVDKDETGVLTYSWYADGVEIGEGKTITASFPNEDEAPRLVEVRMQVTDPNGASTNQTVSFTIEGKPRTQPGFEGPAALAALGAVAACAALLARRRRTAK